MAPHTKENGWLIDSSKPQPSECSEKRESCKAAAPFGSASHVVCVSCVCHFEQLGKKELDK